MATNVQDIIANALPPRFLNEKLVFAKDGQVVVGRVDPLRRVSVLATSCTGHAAMVTGAEQDGTFTVLPVAVIAKYTTYIAEASDGGQVLGFTAAAFFEADIPGGQQSKSLKSAADCPYARYAAKVGCVYYSPAQESIDGELEEERHYLLAQGVVAKQIKIDPAQPIDSLAFSCDGTMLAVGCGNHVAVYEVASCLGPASQSPPPNPFYTSTKDQPGTTEVSWSPTSPEMLAVLFNDVPANNGVLPKRSLAVHSVKAKKTLQAASPAGISAVSWGGDGSLLCGFEDGHVATHDPSTLVESKPTTNKLEYIPNASALLKEGWDYADYGIKDEQYAPKDQRTAVADVMWLDDDANITIHGNTVDVCAAVEDKGNVDCYYNKLFWTDRDPDQEEVTIRGEGDENSQSFPRHKTLAVRVPEWGVALVASSVDPEGIAMLRKVADGGSSVAASTVDLDSGRWRSMKFETNQPCAIHPKHSNVAPSFAGMAIDFTATEPVSQTHAGNFLGGVTVPASPRLLLLCSNGELGLFTFANKERDVRNGDGQWVRFASDDDRFYDHRYPSMKQPRQPVAVTVAAADVAPAFSLLPTLAQPGASPISDFPTTTNIFKLPATTTTTTTTATEPKPKPTPNLQPTVGPSVVEAKRAAKKQRADDAKALADAIQQLKSEIKGDWCTTLENLMLVSDAQKGAASERTVAVAEIQANMNDFNDAVVVVEDRSKKVAAEVGPGSVKPELQALHYTCVEFEHETKMLRAATSTAAGDAAAAAAATAATTMTPQQREELRVLDEKLSKATINMRRAELELEYRHNPKKALQDCKADLHAVARLLEGEHPAITGLAQRRAELDAFGIPSAPASAAAAAAVDGRGPMSASTPNKVRSSNPSSSMPRIRARARSALPEWCKVGAAAVKDGQNVLVVRTDPLEVRTAHSRDNLRVRLSELSPVVPAAPGPAGPAARSGSGGYDQSASVKAEFDLLKRLVQDDADAQVEKLLDAHKQHVKRLQDDKQLEEDGKDDLRSKYDEAKRDANKRLHESLAETKKLQEKEKEIERMKAEIDAMKKKEMKTKAELEKVKRERDQQKANAVNPQQLQNFIQMLGSPQGGGGALASLLPPVQGRNGGGGGAPAASTATAPPAVSATRIAPTLVPATTAAPVTSIPAAAADDGAGSVGDGDDLYDDRAGAAAPLAFGAIPGVQPMASGGAAAATAAAAPTTNAGGTAAADPFSFGGGDDNDDDDDDGDGDGVFDIGGAPNAPSAFSTAAPVGTVSAFAGSVPAQPAFGTGAAFGSGAGFGDPAQAAAAPISDAFASNASPGLGFGQSVLNAGPASFGGAAPFGSPQPQGGGGGFSSVAPVGGSGFATHSPAGGGGGSGFDSFAGDNSFGNAASTGFGASTAPAAGGFGGFGAVSSPAPAAGGGFGAAGAFSSPAATSGGFGGAGGQLDFTASPAGAGSMGQGRY